MTNRNVIDGVTHYLGCQKFSLLNYFSENESLQIYRDANKLALNHKPNFKKIGRRIKPILIILPIITLIIIASVFFKPLAPILCLIILVMVLILFEMISEIKSFRNDALAYKKMINNYRENRQRN